MTIWLSESYITHCHELYKIPMMHKTTKKNTRKYCVLRINLLYLHQVRRIMNSEKHIKLLTFSAIILIVVSLAGIFAFSLSTLGVIDPVTKAIVNSGLGEYGVLMLLILLLITVGMFLDGISIFLIFVPLLLPIMNHYQWDPVWFGVILTLKVALGQFTPPLAVNLMVSCRIANVRMESTIRWVIPMLIAMFGVMLLVIAFPQLALWLPAKLGY